MAGSRWRAGAESQSTCLLELMTTSVQEARVLQPVLQRDSHLDCAADWDIAVSDHITNSGKGPCYNCCSRER